MRKLLLFLLPALLGVVPATAGTVISDKAGSVSVTVYRDPDRDSGEMDAEWPGGYAFITETRHLRIPAGESVIRFEGVAEGMLPETAIVTGLPDSVREKNRDARLISPAGLVDAYLRRSVHLRRTSRETGKVTEQDAVIRAGPEGGVILQTAEGFEALGCSGLPERMLYDRVPEDLSAKPTLSVLTTSREAVDVTVTLSYLAQGFDWSANYVANMDADGRTASLLAWLTVANGGVQSFPDARLQVVAGQPNKVYRPDDSPEDEEEKGGLELQCWPMDTTSTYPKWGVTRIQDQLNKLPQFCVRQCDAIVVTAQMRQTRSYESASPIVTVNAESLARQENLGDLKLYRVPMPVTVAAQGQKQVAMIDKPAARFERVYVGDIEAAESEPNPLMLTLRTRNLEENGLGVPLPAGGLALFEPVGTETLLAVNSDVSDRAVGERFDIPVSDSTDVQWTIVMLPGKKDRQTWRVEVSNAKPVPIQAQISLPSKPGNNPRGLARDENGWLLKIDVPANGRSTVDCQLNLVDPEKANQGR